VGKHGRAAARTGSIGRQTVDTEGGRKGAHANSRFTVPAVQCPVIDPDWQNPEGSLSAIIFGGSAPHNPVDQRSFSWKHGVSWGLRVVGNHSGRERQIGLLRRTVAMLPSAVSHADYFSHWLSFAEKTDRARLPRVYFANGSARTRLANGSGRVTVRTAESSSGFASGGRLGSGAPDIDGNCLKPHSLDLSA